MVFVGCYWLNGWSLCVDSMVQWNTLQYFNFEYLECLASF